VLTPSSSAAGAAASSSGGGDGDASGRGEAGVQDARVWTYRVDIHGVLGPVVQVVVFNDAGVLINREVVVVEGETR
jgi:hypothetical protein